MRRPARRVIVTPLVAAAGAERVLAAVGRHVGDDAELRAATPEALARHLVVIGMLGEHVAQLARLPAAADVVGAAHCASPTRRAASTSRTVYPRRCASSFVHGRHALSARRSFTQHASSLSAESQPISR